ncbi:hypothetical protein E4T56_gene10066 [Termitomyces sp. T112]|nr:hypothetical protein E4T56_gene10066 [Termitomyces sp. T112]
MLAVMQGHMPSELQRLIFETAARRDRSVARQLILVSQNVRTWIEPILYECIIVRSQQHAEALFKTIAAKSQALGSFVKSLAIGDSVTLQQSKDILAACSQNVVNFAVWTNSRNPSVFLPFVRSLSIRRLSLRSTHSAELSVPLILLAALTHLMILDGPYSWFQMREAVQDAKNAINSGYPSAAAQFRSLTHFATCSQNWGNTQSLLKLAANLRYFIVVVSPYSKAAPMIAQRIQEIGDRRMVLVEYSPTIESWESSTRGLSSSVWERAEKLVKDGYFAEHGDVRKWNP